MSDSEEKLPTARDQTSLPDWVTNLPGNTVKSVIKLGKYIVGEGSYYVDYLSEKKRTNQAREILTVRAAEHLAAQYGSDDPLVQRAYQREYVRIVGEQENIEDVTQLALEDLSGQDKKSFANGEIDDDWLYRFYDHAKGFSSDEMKITFAKILSGEIQKPGSFSPKTLEIITTLSKEVGEIFVKAAGCTFYIPQLLLHMGGRIASVGTPLGNNGLQEYGLSYSNLVLLQEYGLISNDLNSWQEFPAIIFTSEGFGIGANAYRLDITPKKPTQQIKFTGVSLTQVGVELFSVIDKKTNIKYFEAFEKWLMSNIEQN